MEINKDEELVKKGINLPIELNGSIVGVVGISGEVKETRPSQIIYVECPNEMAEDITRSGRFQHHLNPSNMGCADTTVIEVF